MQTIEAILHTSPAHIRRSASGATFSVVLTVREGSAARFAAAPWSDESLGGVTPDLIADIGWKSIDQAPGRQAVVRCAVAKAASGSVTAEIDLGSGFVPLPVTARVFPEAA